jgi:hypothetical protein
MDRWSEQVDEILGGDLVAMLVYATPAGGTVLLPVNNYAVERDRASGRLLAINSSVGGWRKLERMRSNPQVGLAFHAREHGRSDRSEYVLVQGRASLSEPIDDYPSTVADQWERFEPWARMGPLWKRWLRVYAQRVEISIAVERTVAWPNLACTGSPTVYGAPLPQTPPAPHRPPSKGTRSRLDPGRAASKAARLPHVLLGWVSADGFPLAVPVEVLDSTAGGLRLRAPEGIVPPGGRRAGLTAHWFSRGAVGQRQRKHTGWLEATADGREVLYAPHTQRNYAFPASKTLYRLVLGGVTRREAAQISSNRSRSSGTRQTRPPSTR